MVHAVRDRAFLPGPPGLWDSEWVAIPAPVITADDIALWPYTPGLLVKWVSFLASLHWPAGGSDLGVGCTCSYSFGQGPAVGPHTGRRCWPLLACVWRAIAPLMKPWCA